MSVNEILLELDALSPDELKVIKEKIELIEEDMEITPEMLAAIEEGRRSIREERTYTVEEILKEIPTWTMDTK